MTPEQPAESGPANASVRVSGRGPGYVLMTAARNEEATIGGTIQSVLDQTCLPRHWVIVSDGSSDRTDEIVKSYAARHNFIQFVRLESQSSRSFASKGFALKAAEARLCGIACEYVGNLDADVSLPSLYFSELMRRFESNPRLGLAGGFVYEEEDGEFRSRKLNSIYSVAHAAQLIRRECYEQIGGYVTLEFGGEDWLAQTTAKMGGWQTEAFTDLPIFHVRRRQSTGSLVRSVLRQGRMDYSFGSDPVFEFFKCLRRSNQPPLYCGGMIRLSSFFWSYIRREQRPVSRQFMDFLRREQRERIRSFFGTGVSKVPK